MIRLRLSKLKIQHKIVLFIIFTSFFSTVLAATSLLWFVRSTFRTSMVEDLLTDAEMSAINCNIALAFDNTEDLERTLKSLESKSSIIFGGVYSVENELMATYHRPDIKEIKQLPQLMPNGYHFENDFITVVTDIHFDNECIGKLMIKSDLTPLESIQKKSSSATLLSLLGGFVLASCLSIGFQKVICKPILSLTKVTKEISKNSDFSVRMERHNSDDEIGVLIDTFNEMLEHIEFRDLALVKANEQLNQSNQELQSFAYVASHDLREPLRKISSFGQLLVATASDKLDEDEQENLNFMIDGANRMKKMIEALLAYSRIETKGSDFEKIDLNFIVQELMEFELAVKIEETSAKIFIPENLHTVKGDPTQIRQLLQNFIGNALKYQKKNTIPEVIVRSQQVDDSMVRIEVQDNGIGIKQDHFQNIFAMFKRLHSKDEYEGTGIGLAICKKIVERHGGTIGISSIYGEGSTFCFTIPVADVNKDNTKEFTEVEIVI